MILSNIMRRKRRELDLAQKEVAKKCHITQSYYAQIETGKMTPSVEILCLIVKALGLQISDVLEV